MKIVNKIMFMILAVGAQGLLCGERLTVYDLKKAKHRRTRSMSPICYIIPGKKSGILRKNKSLLAKIRQITGFEGLTKTVTNQTQEALRVDNKCCKFKDLKAHTLYPQQPVTYPLVTRKMYIFDVNAEKYNTQVAEQSYGKGFGQVFIELLKIKGVTAQRINRALNSDDFKASIGCFQYDETLLGSDPVIAANRLYEAIKSFESRGVEAVYPRVIDRLFRDTNTYTVDLPLAGEYDLCFSLKCGRFYVTKIKNLK